jgi:hypothetical protein
LHANHSRRSCRDLRSRETRRPPPLPPMSLDYSCCAMLRNASVLFVLDYTSPVSCCQLLERKGKNSRGVLYTYTLYVALTVMLDRTAPPCLVRQRVSDSSVLVLMAARPGWREALAKVEVSRRSLPYLGGGGPLTKSYIRLPHPHVVSLSHSLFLFPFFFSFYSGKRLVFFLSSSFCLICCSEIFRYSSWSPAIFLVSRFTYTYPPAHPTHLRIHASVLPTV